MFIYNGVNKYASCDVMKNTPVAVFYRFSGFFYTLLGVLVFALLKDFRKYDPNLHISPLKTNIIIGGTETSGCVFDNKNIGALHWAKRGYDTTIYLPLCCDYSSPGATWELKQLSGISSLWNTVGREIKNSIKNVNITQNLHLTASFDQLSPIIPWSNEKITPL